MDRETRNLIGNSLKLLGQVFANDGNNDLLAQSLLEEYHSLKDEIKHHLSSMHHLTIFNLTASGAIISFWLTDVDTLINLTLMVTILSSILGMIFYYHGRRIYQINSYIKNTITPKIELITNEKDVLNYEEQIGNQDKIWGLSLDSIRVSTYVITGSIALGLAFAAGIRSGLILYIAMIFWLFFFILTGFNQKSRLRQRSS